MRKIILMTLAGLFLSSGLASAQFDWGYGPPSQPPRRIGPAEARDIARYWIKSYLRRGADPQQVRYWADQLQRARDPADALSALLSSREYMNYAGGSLRGLVRQLILDVGHHEPSRFELEDRLRATAGQSPRDIAYGFLREFPANWWPGPQATPPPELAPNYGGGFNPPPQP